jgi:hypothetical protein
MRFTNKPQINPGRLRPTARATAAPLGLTALLALAACGTDAPHEQGSTTQATVRDFEGEHGMQLGAGYQGVVEDVRGVCVTVKPAQAVGAGQETRFAMRLVENTRELAAALNVSSASQLKATIPETAINVSAKTKFLFGHDLAVNRYSVFLLVSATVKNETKNVADADLKPDIAKALAKDPKGYIDRFRTRCGDEFLAGYTTGGEFHGVIEITTDSEDHKTQVGAEISQGVGLASVGDASTEYKLDATLRRIAKEHQVRVWTYQRGGAGEDASPVTTIDQMLARVKALPAIVAKPDAGRALTATFQDYSTLSLDLPAAYLKDFVRGKEAIARFGAAQAQLYDLKADVTYILSKPEAFEGVDEAKRAELTALSQDIGKRLTRVASLASRCFLDLKACPAEDAALGVDVPQVTLPQRVDLARGSDRGVSIHVRPQVIRADRVADTFSGPECYVRVDVVIGETWVPLVQTPTYDDCGVPEQVLETSAGRMREAFAQAGGTEADGWLAVTVWEEDTSHDDFLGVAWIDPLRLYKEKSVPAAIGTDDLLIDVTARLARP